MTKKLRGKSLEAILFPILDVLLNGFNFLAIIFISTRLSQNDFGVFSALVALASVLFIVGISVQTLTAKAFASNESVRTYMPWITMVMATLLTFIYVAMLPWIKVFTRASTLGLVLILLLVHFHLFTSYQRGILQGLGRFKHLNISFYIEVLIRLLATLVLFIGTKSYENALMALVLGVLMAGLHGWYMNRSMNPMTRLLTKGRERVEALKEAFGQICRVIVGNGCLYYMAAIGVLMVNYRLPETSGIYGLATKFSQLILAVAMSITTILLPMAARTKERGKSYNSFLVKWAKGLLALLSLMWLAYVSLLPYILTWIYGDLMSPLMAIIRVQAIAYVFYSISQYLVQMNIVLNCGSHLKILALVSVFYTMILRHMAGSITLVVWLEVMVHGVLMVAMILDRVLRHKRETRSAIHPIRKEQIL